MSFNRQNKIKDKSKVKIIKKELYLVKQDILINPDIKDYKNELKSDVKYHEWIFETNKNIFPKLNK